MQTDYEPDTLRDEGDGQPHATAVEPDTREERADADKVNAAKAASLGAGHDGSGLTPLARLMSLQEFYDTKDGRRLFGSTDSIRWFIRANTPALLAAGAIVKMGRRVMISRPEFDHAVMDIVRKRARVQMAC